MRRRIRKKKGLLKDPVYEKIKERLFQELKEEAAFLERRAEQIKLPEEGGFGGELWRRPGGFSSWERLEKNIDFCPCSWYIGY